MRANNVLPNQADLDQRLEAAALHFDPFSDGFAVVDLVIDLADEVFDTDCDRCGEHDDDPTYADLCCWPGDPQDLEEDSEDCCPAHDDGGSYRDFARPSWRGEPTRLLTGESYSDAVAQVAVHESGVWQKPNGQWMQPLVWLYKDSGQKGVE